MRAMTRLRVFVTIAILGLAAAVVRTGSADLAGWDPKAAASYLDTRAAFWATWSNAQRDHGTFCISCHTTLPYAMARPVLRQVLGETAAGSVENRILDNVLTRARGYKDMEPFYPDQTRGIPKTSESRAIETVATATVIVPRNSE